MRAYANPNYQDCSLYSIDASIANVNFDPDPPQPGVPFKFNYTASGISPTTTSTAIFIAFFVEHADSPFDVVLIQVPSNLTELDLRDLQVHAPIITQSYSIMAGLSD
ncbi:22287_t:CDS:2, partial [Gigaspora margarita]